MVACAYERTFKIKSKCHHTLQEYAIDVFTPIRIGYAYPLVCVLIMSPSDAVGSR